MNFAEAESYLYSLGNEVEAMKLGLENTRTLLEELGEPQTQYLKVQVAGTNGKGSVCAFLDSISREAGIRTGLYTSPHLVSITERIKINGVDVSEDDFARLATRVRETAERLVPLGKLGFTPTYFEQVTAIGLLAFAEARVELAILETGLGGRLDATTAANAEIAAITRIDLDHQEYLGNTIEEIAAEKAAIIVNGQRVAIGRQSPEGLKVLLERCASVGVVPKTGCEPNVLTFDAKGSAVVEFRTSRREHWDTCLGLAGRHQVENACTAIMVSDILRDIGVAISDESVWEGLEDARHPGRLEYTGNFLLDGAHNVAGAKALGAYLDEFVKKPFTMIFGAMREKNVREIAKILWPRAEQLILTQPSNSRAMTAEELVGFVPENFDPAKIVNTNSVEDALAAAGSRELILVTGSLYLVGEVRKIALSRQS